MEKLLLFLFIFSLPIRLWGIEHGFYIYAVDFFAILLTAYYFLFKEKNIKYNSIQVILILHSFWIIVISVLSVIIYKSELSQVIKGVFQLLLYDVFFIFFIHKIQNKSYLDFIYKLVLSTGILIVPLSLINFYTNSFFGVDFIFEFIKIISIGKMEVNDNYLKLTFWIRNSSFAGEPNFLGMYFVFLLQIVLVNMRSFLLKQIIAIILLISILSTFSRAAIICGLFVYVMWTLFLFKRIALYGKISTCVFLLISFTFIYFGQLKTNDEIETAILSLNDRDFASDNQRLNIFSQSLNIFSDHPLGVGPSNYSVFANRLYGKLGEPNPHNSYLTTLVEEGLLGIVLMILLFTILIIKLFEYTNVYYVVGFIIFLLAMLINDFYKISGYKFFIFFTFYIFLNNSKKLNEVNSIKNN